MWTLSLDALTWPPRFNDYMIDFKRLLTCVSARLPSSPHRDTSVRDPFANHHGLSVSMTTPHLSHFNDSTPRSRSSYTTRTPTPKSPGDQGFVIIGVILSNSKIGSDRYKCYEPSCSGTWFGRLADFKRHHASKHYRNSVERQSFRRPVGGGKRARNGGGEPFPRKDRKRDRTKYRHGETDRRSN